MVTSTSGCALIARCPGDDSPACQILAALDNG
jgi:hypothetical protein